MCLIESNTHNEVPGRCALRRETAYLDDSSSYTNTGDLAAVTDPLGRLTWYTYDPEIRPSTQADPPPGLPRSLPAPFRTPAPGSEWAATLHLFVGFLVDTAEPSQYACDRCTGENGGSAWVG